MSEESTLDEIYLLERRAAQDRRVAAYSAMRLDFAGKLQACWHLLAESEEDGQLVYFLRMGEDGPVKIGISSDVKKRVKTLQTAIPYELKLLGAIPGGARAEAFLHQLFDSYRLKGEWFTADPVLLSFLTDLVKARSESGVR